MKPYVDLHPVDENERIRLIGETVMHGHVIAVLLESNVKGKIERYVRKLKERFPMVELLSTTPGPVKNIKTLRFGKKRQ